ncbi:MAG: hypothetical protein ACRDLB_17195, partial [Actinomycetota bacterium]
VFITFDAPADGGRDRELRRFVGEIVAFTANGVFLRLLDGRGVFLPPDLAAFSWAESGTYRLSGIPACVSDPDVVTAWTNHDDGALSRTTPPPPLRDDEWDGPVRLLVALRNVPADRSFDPLRARALTGKSVIVGIRYVDDSGVEVDAKQFYGRIRSFTDQEASVALPDGTYMSLPPAPQAFTWARPGAYKLRSSGQEVQDPDVTTRWIARAGADRSRPSLQALHPDEPGDEGEVVA